MPYEPPFEVPAIPGIFLQFSNALAVGTPQVPHRAVVVGTQLAAGSVDENVPKQILSGAQAEGYWGQGSMIAEMAKAFLAQLGGKTELWGVGVDEEAGGAASAGGFAVSGTATASGTLSLLIAGTRIRVPVLKDQSAATVIDNAVAAIDDVPTLPVDASDGTTDIDLTCKWKGESGNSIDLRLDPNGTVPAGLTVTVTAMADGATDPEIDSALAALGDAKYDTVAVGYVDTTNIEHVDVWLADRWGPLVQKEGEAFVASTGSFSDLTTLAGSLNTKFVVVIGPGDCPTPQWVIAAAAAGADAILTKRQPNAPRNGIVLQGVQPPALEDRFSDDQRDTLLRNGISTAIGTPNNSLMLERLLTTYTQDDLGFPDASYSELAVMRVLGRMRYDLQVWRSRFSSWVVSSDESQANLPEVMTPKRMRGFLTGVYQTWMSDKFCQDLAFFQENLIVEVAENKTDFNVFIPVKLVYPLNAIAGDIAHV